MAIFKCKMCGGTIEFQEGETIGVCDSCGTKQTLPKTQNEMVANLFNRANNLRLKCEFDKAMAIYEKIVEEDDSEAEAHWGIVLCKYGIEYVTDPESGEKVPTCHRTLYEAVTTDADYQAAIDYSDISQQAIYEAEARTIDRIQKGILSIAQKEEPFDVFICYKEADENGKRTSDSVIANDIYYQLTQEGLKVFYAAITLEDKLGQEYEPYIFAALNSAKVMLAIGTRPEYFNAVWVKNEWSRFLKIMKDDRSRLLIPCYRDMDAYELPEEFAHLQAQDMSKIGFINDVVRGIKKVIAAESPKSTVKETVIVNNTSGNANIAPLLTRVFMFLEDGAWKEANEYCEKVLDIDPKNAEAYLGKLMAELEVGVREELGNCKHLFDDSKYFQKVVRFGDDKLKKEMEGYLEEIREHMREIPSGSDYVFGTYPQAASGTDNTPIEWIVLDVDKANNKMLLLSKYALDRKRYDDNSGNWANSEIRSWLNNTFIGKAFNSAEQARILNTTITNPDGPYTHSGDVNTTDKVFLLSYNEVKTKYASILNGPEGRVCSATAYATAQGAYEALDYCGTYTDTSLSTCFWWLRSPNNDGSGASIVYGVGGIHGDGIYYGNVNYTNIAVRPALWISLP